jgi:hypothetical protein
MTEVMLPQPVDEAAINEAIYAEKTSPTIKKPNKTIAIFIIIVFVAASGLLVGLGYNYFHSRDQDKTRKQDLSYISGLSENFFSLNNYYPTLEQLNSSSFSAFYPNGIDRQKFKDPSGSSSLLVASPNAQAYAYQASPLGCNNTNLPCKSYKLTAIISDGKNFVVTSSPINKSNGNK